MAEKVHVFVDNSNVWIEGKRISGRLVKPRVDLNHRYRIEFGKLLGHVMDGRELASVPKLYGSEPPPNDSVWNIIKAKGFDVKIFKRNIYNKEKGVDMRMGLDIQRLVLKEESRETIAIVAGDADFVEPVKDAHEAGWKVEVWYWSNAAGDLKTSADRFIELNGAVYQIGFDER